jgi:type I restriction enzyme S subunit
VSFSSYQSYKNSGVDWLGKIPGDWSLGKFRHLFTESSEKIESEVHGEMLSVSGYRGIEVKEYSDENQKRTEENLIGYRIVHEGQLVVNTMWLNYAGLGISQLEGHVSPAYRSYWVDSSLHKPFVHHLMRSSLYVLGYTKYLTGVRPNSLQMSRDDLMGFPILIPTLTEQKSIATFLDHETVKIDTLVAEQEKLIELLKEKRQAVISHSVTKGLEPKVKMKDSGVEWLGEVPEHWEVKPLKYLGSIIPGYAFNSSDFTKSGIRVLKIANIQTNKIDWSDDSYLPDEFFNLHPKFVVRNDDVVFALTRPIISTGLKAAVVDIGNEQVLLNQRNALFRPIDRISKLFIYQVLFSDSFLIAFENKIDFTGQQPNISTIDIGDIKIPVPPLDEQESIATYLKSLTEDYDKLTYEAQKTINLLKERRSSVISAAVTGQIDVRNYQAKEAA